MRNLTVAILLTLMFCAVSVIGKDAAKRSSNSADSSMIGKVKNFFGRLNYNRSFRDTLWEERLKDWQRRHSGVPQSLPRATFQLQRQSVAAPIRGRRTFRSSSPKIRVRTSSCCSKTISIKTNMATFILIMFPSRRGCWWKC